MRITVLMGGTSAERDVSLATGLRVTEALRSRGHQVTVVDTVRGSLSTEEEGALISHGTVRGAPPTPESLQRMARAALPATVRVLPQPSDTDVVFLALHGGHGEDGTIQAILDLSGMPYTGSGHLASALAMDKDLSKHLFKAEGVGTAEWMMVHPDVAGLGSFADVRIPTESPRVPSRKFLDLVPKSLGLPVIVKPSKQGSTVGLSIVKQADELAGAIAEAFRHDDEVMIERFIPGRELTVGILGSEALPVGEIIPKHEIYDYECKYTAGMAEEIFPADIPDDRRDAAQEQARRAFAALKLRGYARIDFRMTDDGELFCLEANTLPGMTSTSLIPQAAAAAGIEFPLLCERIVQLALDSYDK
jgi:D-alanine-D-alanine ligase